MKKLLMIVASLWATAAFGQWYDDPAAIGEGRELPRTGLTFEAQYIQPLEWRAVDGGGDSTIFEASYKVPFAWAEREVFLRVPYAAGAYEVSVNGRQAGYTASAHSANEWDVTRLSHEGNNTIRITIFHQPVSRQIEQYAPEQVTPAPPLGAEIISQPRVRIRDVVIAADVANGAGQLTFGAVMATHLLNEKQVRLHYELFAPDSTRLFWGHRDEAFSMREQDTITFFHRIDAPEIWSPSSPRLYTLILKVQQGGRYVERVEVKVGLRGDVKIDPATMREFTPSGDVGVDARLLEAARAQGINTLLVTPHPATEAFYTLCDQLGFYLVPQADIDTRRAGDTRLKDQNPTNMPAWRAAYLDRVEQMYHTSKTHPSVVGFSLAGQAANGYNLYEAYLHLKSLSSRRRVIYFGADGEWNSDR